jgi:6-phosphogluconolactonase
MRIGTWARVLLAAAPLLAGCGNFWQAPSGSTSFSLANSGAISVSPGSTNTATITVTPSNSFTGTVSLSCAVTSTPSSATSPATCSLSPTSVTISDTSAQTSTLTAATTSSTTTGAYEVAVTGTSSSVSESTTVCVEVGSSSGTCGSNSSTSGVFYVLNQTTDQIVAMKITSGLPAAVPLAIAVAPNGNFLYVSTGYGIFLYTIGSNGALTLENNAPISQDTPNTMQVDATNSWLVEAVSGMGQLNAIAINSNTGALAVSGETEQFVALPSSANPTVKQLAISPNDSSSCNSCYVFVAMGSGGTEAIYFNPGNTNPFGSASHINLANSAGGANTVAVDPSNRLLYVGETNALPSATQTGGLRAFTIAAITINEISGSPFASAGAGPIAIQPTADGNYVYVANRSVTNSTTGNIAGFSVSTTSLTSIGSVAAGPAGAIALAEDSTGSFLLAVDFAGDPDLEAYSMSSGTLTSALTGSTGTDPVGAVAIAAAP